MIWLAQILWIPFECTTCGEGCCYHAHTIQYAAPSGHIPTVLGRRLVRRLVRRLDTSSKALSVLGAGEGKHRATMRRGGWEVVVMVIFMWVSVSQAFLWGKGGSRRNERGYTRWVGRIKDVELWSFEKFILKIKSLGEHFVLSLVWLLQHKLQWVCYKLCLLPPIQQWFML